MCRELVCLSYVMRLSDVVARRVCIPSNTSPPLTAVIMSFLNPSPRYTPRAVLKLLSARL